MNETLKTLCERRSVRRYTEKQIDDETLFEILKAGEYAPSGMNRQSTVMVVIQDEDTLEILRKLNSGAKPVQNGSDPFYGAPTVVAVLADKRVLTCVEDGSLVIGNLMNAAHSLGVASCWIHRARETFESDEGKKLLDKWGLDDNYIGVGNCILGYAEESPAPSPRREGRIIRE